jgi:hypothetical protein
MWPVMNVEGGDQGGGGAAPVEPTKAADPAPAPAPAPKVAPRVLRMQPKAAPADRASIKTISSELDTVRKTSEETKKALDTTAAELLTERFESAFDAARVKPAYRKFVRDNIGDINPRTDAGKKAIDDFVGRHPEIVLAAAAPKSPQSGWLDVDGALAKDKEGKSLASRMGRGMLEATLDKLVQ